VSAATYREGEKRDRLLGTSLMAISAALFAWQVVPWTRHAFDLGALSTSTIAVWPYAGWRLRNSYGADNHEAPQFRSPQSRRRGVAFMFLIGLAALISSLVIEYVGV
jgi:hypothetical protein